jgi:Cellulose biosynthesis protein BcsG
LRVSNTTDSNRFVDDLRSSNRRVLLVLIPEHGAAVRGDKRQMQGLREIPTPAITHVPVAVMLVNAPGKAADAVVSTLNQPVSYMALNELLSRMMIDNPFIKTSLSLSAYTKDLPQTDSIAENEGTVMMSQGKQAMMRTPDGVWSRWDEAI